MKMIFSYIKMTGWEENIRNYGDSRKDSVTNCLDILQFPSRITTCDQEPDLIYILWMTKAYKQQSYETYTEEECSEKRKKNTTTVSH